MKTQILPFLALLPLLLGCDEGPFAPSLLSTADGKKADPDSFFEAKDCGECHVDQYRDWNGSMHQQAHRDPIYLAFAHRAREEGGDDLYRFCSSCHAPLGVVTGEIPGGKPTYLTDEGVTCDVCHSASEIRTGHAGGGANASLVLRAGDTRWGPLADPAPNPNHESAEAPIHRKAEFCSACHSLLHPANGLVIENTYEEWKKGPYAAAGIQCQDCHMRTVEQAVEVARTMKPLAVPGRTLADGDPRPDVHAHLFVGANVSAGGERGKEAERRLQSAATVALGLPASARAGERATIVVKVTNVAAGHAIPTSITELRQVWIDLEVTDAGGKTVFRSGAVAETGAVDPGAVMYHSVLLDAEGKVTYLPWRAVKMSHEKLIAPKETANESYEVALPEGVRGPLKVRATLRYRSAPKDVMDNLFGKGTHDLPITDMASAEGELGIGR